MLIKSIVLLAITTMTTHLALATPPACLLGAVGSQATPSDVKGVCGNATSVENSFASACGDNLQAAVSAFSSICSSAGVAISTASSLTMSSSLVSTTSSEASTTITSSGSASGSSHMSSTSSSSISPSKSSGTDSSSATQTAAAVKKQMDAMGIGIVAVARLMLIL